MERRLVPLKGCFAGATLVITRDGPVPIRDLVAVEAEFLSTSGDPARETPSRSGHTRGALHTGLPPRSGLGGGGSDSDSASSQSCRISPVWTVDPVRGARADLSSIVRPAPVTLG